MALDAAIDIPDDRVVMRARRPFGCALFVFGLFAYIDSSIHSLTLLLLHHRKGFSMLRGISDDRVVMRAQHAFHLVVLCLFWPVCLY